MTTVSEMQDSRVQRNTPISGNIQFGHRRQILVAACLAVNAAHARQWGARAIHRASWCRVGR